MLNNAVNNYLATAKGLPFFYGVGDADYKTVLDDLKQNGIKVDRVSEFCKKDDKYPDIDEIVDHFRTLDIDHTDNKHVIIGMGEYLALRGQEYAKKILIRLKNTTLGNARVIILLRCVTNELCNMENDDRRLVEQNRIFISDSASSDISVLNTSYSLDKSVANGVKGLLYLLENGTYGQLNMKSVLDFSLSMIPVSVVNSVFVALKKSVSGFNLEEKLGTEKQWEQLYCDISKSGSLKSVFIKNGFTLDIYDELYDNCIGMEYKKWLYFLYLKQNIDKIDNEYLKYVLSNTESSDQFKENVLTEIIRISRSDTKFTEYYGERKKLLKQFPESELAIFVYKNSVDLKESIYRLTDITELERKEVVRWITYNGIVNEIEYVYPALWDYLGSYTFNCGTMSDLLTKYFKEYRLQKITNRIETAFLKKVEEYAKKLPYAHLESRDSAILKIQNKQSAFLYWIDALGVEYLPYITELVRRKGLSMHVDVARADLPTITCKNKSFYEQWPGEVGKNKIKTDELDEIKHKDKGGYNYSEDNTPVHIVSELKIIEQAIDIAATKLGLHECSSFVIASDHGASRLAVIHQQEEKYETDTKGEHSGRCCKLFNNYDLECAVEENDYVVLADYGRFKKSRAANVEVHGGASLEEVVVPIITLKLKKQVEQTIKLIGDGPVYADRHIGTDIHLYITDVMNPNQITVEVDEKRYSAKSVDSQHFDVNLSDIRRKKDIVNAKIYEADELIGTITFSIKGKIASTNSDFDF